MIAKTFKKIFIILLLIAAATLLVITYAEYVERNSTTNVDTLLTPEKPDFPVFRQGPNLEGNPGTSRNYQAEKDTSSK